MREIVALSGKGGTGKTTMVASFAALAKSKVLADCDVDAADLHLLLSPRIIEEREFWSAKVASINRDRCNECGLCERVCRFDAISGFEVDSLACEGCGFCHRVCPEEAITLNQRLSGHWFISWTKYGPLVHARLGPGQENSGKLVAAVRQQARAMAYKQGVEFVLSDGPPGIGCPVVSALTGVSLALVVTEPTPSGIHDLERILGVCRHFRVPAAVCINKYDLDEGNTRLIEACCEKADVPVLSRIPFDTVVTDAIVRGVPLVEHSEGAVSRQIEKLWQKLSSTAGAKASSARSISIQ